MGDNELLIRCFCDKNCDIEEKVFPVYNENFVLQKGLIQCEECYRIQLNVDEYED